MTWILNWQKPSPPAESLPLGQSLHSRFRPGVFPLNPENRTLLDLSFTQPLLQGGGTAANLAGIVIARIDTERSYFQFKDSVQEMVRGVIEAYWSLVFARTDLWARDRQVEQARFAYELTCQGPRRRGERGRRSPIAVGLCRLRGLLPPRRMCYNVRLPCETSLGCLPTIPIKSCPCRRHRPTGWSSTGKGSSDWPSNIDRI